VDGGVFHATWLDEYVPDRPVFLRATDYHTVWVNSVALERAGYQGEITQPHDGEIVLDDSGKPIGTLREWGAWLPVYELIPQPDHETKIAGLKFATESCAAAGLTWVQEAWVDLADIDVWKRAHSESALAVDVDLALWADSNSWRDQLHGEVFRRRRGGVRNRCAP
jgi:predicted amidohydrolase YtcJ